MTTFPFGLSGPKTVQRLRDIAQQIEDGKMILVGYGEGERYTQDKYAETRLEVTVVPTTSVAGVEGQP